MILKVPEACDCDVLDANGTPLQYAVWCDTETGEAVHILQPPEFTIADNGDAGLRQERRKHPAPLKVKWRR